MKRLLAIAVILIFTVGCHHKAHVSSMRQVPAEKEVITQKYSLQPFRSIVLNGKTTVELVNGSYAASITDAQENLQKYQFNVINHVLHVSAPVSANNTTIIVFAPGLKNITVTGNATVNAKNFETSGLTIAARNNGTVNLEGQYVVDKIFQRGNGSIDISWINSDNLFIDSHSSGSIYLAGTVNSMVVKLMHNAQFDARYLRAQKASVFATDNARADILVLGTLGAFAINNSNIFYHKKPQSLTVVTKGSGNVLHSDWVH